MTERNSWASRMEKPKDARKELGCWGEEQAAYFLTQRGLTIVERNWRAKSGEIDLIARDDQTLVFVEVRTRRESARFGTPEESVNVRKQRQVRDMAALYLRVAGKYGCPCRFDVIAVTAGDRRNSAVIRHLVNAF